MHKEHDKRMADEVVGLMLTESWRSGGAPATKGVRTQLHESGRCIREWAVRSEEGYLKY